MLKVNHEDCLFDYLKVVGDELLRKEVRKGEL